jgi:hypothetical protein
MSKDKENHAKKHVSIPPGTDLNGDTKLYRLEAAPQGNGRISI